jgi:tRNA(Ile)-lysidine synthase
VTNLPEHVGRSIRQRTLLKERERVVVAVSGGMDSTVLLHLLQELAAAHRWKLAVAHLNHQLRGRSSDADERFVCKLAERFGLPCFVERAEVRSFATRQKLSVEMASRRLRHEFLVRCARRFNARTVAVAHHADDQVELFFLRVLRGAGGEGLQGMKWRSPSPVNFQSFAFDWPDGVSASSRKPDPPTQLVRPLLDVPREELRRFATGRKLAFRQDASNASLDFLRNRIRHRLLPLLQREFQPAIGRTVTRLMEIVGAEAAFARDTAEAWLKGGAAKRAPHFDVLPLAIQRAAVRLQLLERGVVLDFDLVESLVAAVDRRVSVGMNLAVWRDERGRVHAVEAAALRFSESARLLELKGRSGQCDFGTRRFDWRRVQKRGAKLPGRIAGGEWFDADAIGPTLILRHWRAGDRFQPIGLPKAAKLQDLLTNASVPAVRRRELTVATTADGRIFWVEGLRIGEAAKLTPATIRRLQWRWQRL